MSFNGLRRHASCLSAIHDYEYACELEIFLLRQLVRQEAAFTYIPIDISGNVISRLRAHYEVDNIYRSLVAHQRYDHLRDIQQCPDIDFAWEQPEAFCEEIRDL